MNARWIKLAHQHHNMLPSAGPMESWAAVTDDDEIIGNVAGYDQMWTAQANLPGKANANGPMGANNYASFISEEGAKRRVEQWLAPTYTFPQASANTGWTYKV